MAELRIQDLSKSFKGDVAALRGISLDVADREAVFLLGPSGAGKTTTLRLVSGLEEVTSGAIRLGGRDITSWSPRERNVAMVYDKHSLFPHMTVFDNLAYPLKIRRMSASAIRERTSQVAETLQIGALMDRYPSQLSGGQMQRVAIGRALVRDADAYLLDEPISHLDAQLRARMRVEFKRLQREFQATMLYVSHDQLEAMTMADRIALINNGEIEQIAPPQQMFDEPATLFAATFVGEPPMNVLEARLREDGAAHLLTIGRTDVRLDEAWVAQGEPMSPSASYIAGIRPQHIRLAATDDPGDGIVPGRIFAVEALGSRVIFDVEIEGRAATEVVRVLTSVDEARRFPQQIGAPAAVRVDPDFIYLFDAASDLTVRQARFTKQGMH